MHQEEKISSKTEYEGRIITVRQDAVKLENGRMALRDVVQHPGGVAVLAMDAQEQVYMVEQFRYPTGQALWELPAGKLEYGEDPRECGIRELKEETGCTAEQFELLGALWPTPAYCNERIYIYLATGLNQGEQSLDENEFLTARRMPLAKVQEMILTGEIEDAKTQIGVLKYLAMKG